MRSFALFLLVAGLLSGGGAIAEVRDWRVIGERSELIFVYRINGGPRRGAFKAFTGSARFDPEKLEEATFRFDVEVESVETANSFETEIIKTSDWLDAYRYPNAQFELSRLTPRPNGKYGVEGTLTMKEVSFPVKGALEITLSDDASHSKGRVTFDRRDFNIGVGFTALFVEVGDEIVVRFDLIAEPEE